MEQRIRESRGYDYSYGLEALTGTILEQHGYLAMQAIDSPGSAGDLVIERDKTYYTVDVIVSRTLWIQAKDLLRAADRMKGFGGAYHRGFTPMLVTGGAVRPDHREVLRQKHPEMVLIDIDNLLFLAHHDDVLLDQLTALLPFSVADRVPVPPQLHFEMLPPKRRQPLEAQIKKLETWNAAAETSNAYEQLCSETLRMLFSDDLALWKEQQKSDDGLFRFDMICKIKNENTKEFWNMMERYFSSKYIVFEYKNYRGPVTQREVFTTVKYLYAKALRSVAILIGANGVDLHADRAIRGILREEGKLILSLSNQDMINMLKMKRVGDDPSDYLSEKLDALLIDLEK